MQHHDITSDPFEKFLKLNGYFHPDDPRALLDLQPEVEPVIELIPEVVLTETVSKTVPEVKWIESKEEAISVEEVTPIKKSRKSAKKTEAVQEVAVTIQALSDSKE